LRQSSLTGTPPSPYFKIPMICSLANHFFISVLALTKTDLTQAQPGAARGGTPQRSWGYSPYVTHVVTLETFFQIAVAGHHISNERPSNQIDVLYLSYLAFCKVFMSSDMFHRRCTPRFLWADRRWCGEGRILRLILES
jgi:hypothetical protein